MTVCHTAIGLNYVDAYHCASLYPLALPSGLGLKAAAAGVIEGYGPRHDVQDFLVGDQGLLWHWPD